MDRQSEIKRLIEPAIQAMGCELWGVEYVGQGKNAMLRIYIEKEDGVQVDDCEKVSRQVSAVLDVEDPIQSAYTLEVSSPGLDRLLFEKQQYEAFLGVQLKIRLRTNFEGRRNFSGVLAALEEDEVVLRAEDQEYVFPIESIDRAQVVPTFN